MGLLRYIKSSLGGRDLGKVKNSEYNILLFPLLICYKTYLTTGIKAIIMAEY